MLSKRFYVYFAEITKGIDKKGSLYSLIEILCVWSKYHDVPAVCAALDNHGRALKNNKKGKLKNTFNKHKKNTMFTFGCCVNKMLPYGLLGSSAYTSARYSSLGVRNDRSRWNVTGVVLIVPTNLTKLQFYYFKKKNNGRLHTTRQSWIDVPP